MESVFFLSHRLRPTYVVSPSVIPDCSVVVTVGILNISCIQLLEYEIFRVDVVRQLWTLQAVQRP